MLEKGKFYKPYLKKNFFIKIISIYFFLLNLVYADINQKIIEKLKSKNIGVLITDHNVRETLTITDRSYLLYNGKILKSGTTKELTEDEEAKKLYLGTKFRMDID